jgi:hypothetical protein
LQNLSQNHYKTVAKYYKGLECYDSGFNTVEGRGLTSKYIFVLLDVGMKKKNILKKATTHKTIKRTTPRSSSEPHTILFRRVIIISTCLVLVVIAASLPKGSATQVVAGVSITKGIFKQATITWKPSINLNYTIKSYNIYYDRIVEKKFTNAVRNISPSQRYYIVSYLKPGVTYTYQVAAVDAKGAEHFLDTPKPITNLQSM